MEFNNLTRGPRVGGGITIFRNFLLRWDGSGDADDLEQLEVEFNNLTRGPRVGGGIAIFSQLLTLTVWLGRRR